MQSPRYFYERRSTMRSVTQTLDHTGEHVLSSVAMCVNGHKCSIKSQGPSPKRLTYLWEMILVLFVFFASSNYDAAAQELVKLHSVTGIFCNDKSQLKAVAEKINEGVPEHFVVKAGGGEYQCLEHSGASYRKVANPTVVGRVVINGTPMLICRADLIEVVLGGVHRRISEAGKVDLPTYFLEPAAPDAICLEAI